MGDISRLSYEHQQLVEAMKSQLLIVLFNRLGGRVEIPVSEVDGTGKYNLEMAVDQSRRTFIFEVVEKKRG